jgi:hypothetical protein
MNALVEYWDHETVIRPDTHYEERGDVVDDVLRRLDKVETDMSALRADVSKLQIDVGIIASNYATKTDVANLKTELKDEIRKVSSKVESMEGKIIKWFVATGMGIATFAFAVAKYLH